MGDGGAFISSHQFGPHAIQNLSVPTVREYIEHVAESTVSQANFRILLKQHCFVLSIDNALAHSSLMNKSNVLIDRSCNLVVPCCSKGCETQFAIVVAPLFNHSAS